MTIENIQYENKYFEQGYLYIAGVDECGRGSLAGPVAAAAVIFPRGCLIEGVTDSKKLGVKKREALFPVILERALAVGIAMVDADIIDEINILQASLRAMGAALSNLSLRPEIALIDGRFLPDIHLNPDVKMEALIGGDGKSLAIGAASIVAKVTRDRLMAEYAKTYPAYGFDKNKGYGTAAHYAVLRDYGPCPIHRRSFRLE